MTSATFPDVTPFGFDSSYGLGDDMGLFTYEDGTVRFRHRCDRGRRGTIFCAPALQIGSGHTLTWDADGLPTVQPSILCDDCDTHGFITSGIWQGC